MATSLLSVYAVGDLPVCCAEFDHVGSVCFWVADWHNEPVFLDFYAEQKCSVPHFFRLKSTVNKKLFPNNLQINYDLHA